MIPLALDEVVRSYRRGAPVLDGVSLTLEPGQVIGLLGRNGAGKTTLIRLVMGMLAPEAGRVRVFGLDPREKPVEVKRRIGYVAEDQVLPPGARLGALIGLHRSLFPSWDQPFAEQLLQRFALDPSRKIGSLSRGEARRAALLCAAAHRPELLVLDEPASGLDPVARREFLETAVQLLAESGTAILFSTHQMTDVERLASHVALLDGGKIVIDCPLDELRENYSLARADRSLAERLRGVPECVRVREHGDAVTAVLRLPPEEAAARLDLPAAISAAAPLEELFIELTGEAA